MKYLYHQPTQRRGSSGWPGRNRGQAAKARRAHKLEQDPPFTGLHRKLAIVSLSCSNCMAGIDAASINVALPTIAHDLGVDIPSSVLVITVYQLVLLMTALPVAALGEKLGVSRLYRMGPALMLVTSLACGLAWNLPSLVAARGLQAIGASIILTISPAVIRSIYPPDRLGKGLALNSLVTTLSATLAPLLGGVLLTMAGWHWIFFCIWPFAAVSLVFGRHLPTTPRHERPYDYRGAAMTALMFLLVIGGAQLAASSSLGPLWPWTVAAGLVLAVVVLRRERRQGGAILPVDLMARAPILAAILGSFFVYAVFQSMLVNLPFTLQHGFGYSPARIGLVMTAFPVALMIFAPLAGHLSDRFSPRLLCLAGMTACAAGVAALAMAPAGAGVPGLAWRLFLFGAGMALFFVPNSRYLIGAAPRQRVAAAGGLMVTTRLTGQTAGASLAALLLTAGTGLGGTFAVSSLLLCLGALLASLFYTEGRRLASAGSAQ